LGKADVRALYLKKKYTITVTDFQCALLLLFNGDNNNNNNNAAITWEEFSASSNMVDSELAKTLSSLVSSKLITRGADVGEDGAGASYTLNTSYSNKHLKFKITSGVQAETDKDKKKTYKQVRVKGLLWFGL
jgi:hypothetical protein